LAKQKETSFKEKVKDDLKIVENCWYVKIQQRSIRGIPDLLLCINGMFVAIELKTDKGIVSPLQKHILSQITLAKGLGLVAQPKNWKSVLTALIALGRGENHGSDDSRN
jgi:hypothetical protein